MEMTELSLAPRQAFLDQEIKHTNNNISSPDQSRKRKFLSSTNYSSSDHHHLHHHHHMVIKNHNIGISSSSSSSSIQASVDLHLKDPLPLDWEQCLDLESGKMYYLNRKTLRKSWNYPKDRKLDLELNISSSTTSHSSYLDKCRGGGGNTNSRGSSSSEMSVEDSGNYYKQKAVSSSSNMVALACLNCHLLVILSKSSPSCPNCKYVHSLPITLQSPHDPKTKIISNSTKSLSTLSLLH